MASPHKPKTAASSVLQAVKVTPGNFVRTGEASYMIVEPQVAPRDKRLEARRRTHLQCGMILDRNDRFLIDCQIYDRSRHGARLRLAANLRLPRQIHLFDDLAGQMLDTEIVWRRGQNAGVRFSQAADLPSLSEVQIKALRRKFYLGSRKTASGARAHANAP